MIIEFHTPKGIVRVNTETVTNKQLQALGIKRENLPKAPRDYDTEIDSLDARLQTLDNKVKALEAK